MNRTAEAILKDMLETRILGLFDEAVKSIDTEDIIDDDELKELIQETIAENIHEEMRDWAEEIVLDLL